jgi:uncharacterized protein (TIGR02145 family)
MKKTLLLFIICFIYAFVLISCNKDNNPVNSGVPSAPVLVSPLNNATNISISALVTWSPVTGADIYNLEVASDSMFSIIIINKDSIQGINYQLTGLSDSSSYYWKVCASNTSNKSNWSETWKFSTGIAPAVPILLSPSNYEASVFLPVTFSWNASEGATKYTLQIATSSAFNIFAYDQENITSTSQDVTVLKPLTQYFWRVSATNSNGTSDWSGPIRSFTTASGLNTGTPCPGLATLVYSGVTYHTIQIGTQCWLKENLNTGKMITGNLSQINNNITERYCYNNDTINCTLYGGLYQWDEAMQYQSGGTNVQGICPTGWHIPSNNEFIILSNAVDNNGNSLKALYQGSGNGAGTDASGFSLLLAGYRGLLGSFYDITGYTNLWTSIESDSANAGVTWFGPTDNLINQNNSDKSTGFSVRCIKN